MAFILFRGEYDKRRDPVKADTPKSMPPMPNDLPRNRLGAGPVAAAARAPADGPRHGEPLLAGGLRHRAGPHQRRLRHRRRAAEPPRAARLAGGRVPRGRLGREAVLQAARDVGDLPPVAVATPEKLEKDRDNRLLSRGPRFRMDAEMIRDHALAASGLLVRKLGGPSVKPYQPDGVWEAVAMIGSNTRDYRATRARTSTAAACTRSGSGPPRRPRWRSSTPPTARRAPSAATAPTRRSQALLTLNDVQFVEAARVLAEKAITSADADDARIGFVTARLLARPFRPEELAIVKESLADLRTHYKGKPGRREEADRLRRVEGRPEPGPGRTGGVDDARQPADEPGRSPDTMARLAPLAERADHTLVLLRYSLSGCVCCDRQ
jgi:hypothetical protein